MNNEALRITEGLSNKEVALRLVQFGRNEIPAQPKRNILQITCNVLTEPMFLLLLLAASLYLLFGDLAEGLLLSTFAVLTVGMVIIQERRSEQAIVALKALGTPYALVVRSGITQRIDSTEIVPGDLLIVEEGERVAADGILLNCQDLMLDESLLTGESVPVSKQARTFRADKTMQISEPGGDGLPFVYSGTMVTRGKGLAQVSATGKNTQMGHIGASLSAIELEPTRLQKSTGKMVRLFGINALVISLAIVIFYGISRGDWLQGVLSGIALAMAMLPEEFPLALSIFFAMGAWRLAKIKVLARRSAVIETLGATTVLCVDKTGTLTENKMRVSQLYASGLHLSLVGSEKTLPEHFHRLLEYAQLATRHRTFDPMDLAISKLAHATLVNTEHLHELWPLHKEYGLTQALLAMSQVWQSNPNTFEVASKGAPEAIADLCHCSSEQTQQLMQQVAVMANAGLRILAVAAGRHSGTALPALQHDFNFELLGLIGFEDPIRSSVPNAVSEARNAGIKVMMLTGDYPATASEIAKQAGIDANNHVLTGAEIVAMDDAELRDAIQNTSVYARIMPEQKLRLVQALKASGEVVAMTGDGVNDAPALKAAHIGIAMGKSGTDVAREAAAIVLLEEDFGRIVDAIRLGRRIFDNLRKVMLYIIAVHVPIAGLAIIPLLLGWPIMLMPMHVVLIEMIIDPMCSFAFESEPEEKDLMQQAPRPLNDLLVAKPQLILGILQGLVLLAACLMVYRQSLLMQHGEETARTLGFLTLTAANLMMTKTIASRGYVFNYMFGSLRRNYWLITVLAIVVVTICITLPWLRHIFGFAVPDIKLAAIAVFCGLIAGASMELVKWHPWVYRTLGGIQNAKAV
jgi:P-type Ca2+ transporter type 2C